MVRLLGCFAAAWLVPLPFGRGGAGSPGRGTRRAGGGARRGAQGGDDAQRARHQDMVRGLVLATALACATDPKLRAAAEARWGTALPDGTWERGDGGRVRGEGAGVPSGAEADEGADEGADEDGEDATFEA